LALSNPEIFPNQELPPEILSEQNNSNEHLLFALKIYHHFSNHALSHEFFHHLKGVFDKNQYIEYLPFLFKILIDKQRKAKIIESSSFFNLEFLLLLFSFDDYKLKFLDVVTLGTPWIPGPANMNLTKGFGSTQGNFMEMMSCLGVFVQISTFPNIYDNKEIFEILMKRISEEFEHIKMKKDFNLKAQYYFDLISSYNTLLAEVFKSLLKKGNLQYVKSQNFIKLILTIGNFTMAQCLLMQQFR